MEIIESTSGFQKVKKGGVVTIGNFDGVHAGHQEILQVAKQIAQERQTELIVMTFEPHPVTILHPEKSPGVLTPLDLKKHLLENCGVDCLVVLKDSYELLNLSPEDFVTEFLVKTTGPAVVVEGPNFNFGYGRSGNIETLQRIASERNFEVVTVPLKQMHIHDRRAVMCSSSLIRSLLEEGNVDLAIQMLTRPYRLIGQTVPGRGIGAKLGFPTANIHPVDQIVPAEGVYAGYVEIAELFEDICSGTRPQPAVFSIGRAKTFVSEHPVLIEAHILQGPVGDLYGKWLAMDFIRRIRSQLRFESSELLRQQIAADCQTAREMLSQP
jgi:riboflavin kinase/FMN adenylyltransferase